MTFVPKAVVFIFLVASRWSHSQQDVSNERVIYDVI